MAQETPQILFVFIDGLGMGDRNPAINPLYTGKTPVLAAMLDAATPIDAQLGVPGLAQSASGQTALLTGVNAPRMLGKHLEGFPNEALKRIIREHNIYESLKTAGGFQCTFANAYYIDTLEGMRQYRRQSVTTVAALSGIGTVRMKGELFRHEAVYHDLTRFALRERGYTGPLITPEESADDLLNIALRNDFTLFEYFMTDRMGHRGGAAEIGEVLMNLDRFFGVLLERLSNERLLLVMTSDHGNVEDSRSAQHTANPVPFVAQGYRADELRMGISSLTDVTPAILRIFGLPEKAFGAGGGAV